VKGVVLAGGLGSRLRPLTAVTNKHLLPVYDQPMIFYPIQTLVNAGVTDILIVTGGNSAGDFLKLLGNGRAFGLKHLNYTYQEGEGGIAEALSLAQHFSAGEPLCIVLGDNIIEGNIREAVRSYREQGKGAKILLKRVPDPQRFGVPELSGHRVLRIEEKPQAPKSEFAVIGIYMYDAEVFDIISNLKPSARGELEITDVNNAYIERGEMTWDELAGWWSDAGTFESLLHASNLVAQTGANKVEERDVARVGTAG
jgi:glucose-1-phosphate thymidylyltransferase